MPNAKQSPLMAKYGSKLDEAVKKRGGDEVDFGNKFGQLPGGIKGGVARLSKSGFSTFKKGVNKDEFFWRGEGTVIEPAEFAGLGTSMQIAVCATTVKSTGVVTSQEDNVAAILNEFRKLGLGTENCNGADLERLSEVLVQAGPYFRFSTTLGNTTPEFPEARVWENWHGSKGVEDYKEPTPEAAAVQDDSGDGDSTPLVAQDMSESFGDEIDMLVTRCNEDDGEASKELTKIAHDAGVDPAIVKSTASWAEVADLIRTARTTQPEESEGAESFDLVEIAKLADADPPDQLAVDTVTKAGEEAGIEDTFVTYIEYATEIVKAKSDANIPDYTPAKDDKVSYKASTNAKNLSKCVVTAVHVKAETVNIRNITTKKVYKGVAWDKLVVEA